MEPPSDPRDEAERRMAEADAGLANAWAGSELNLREQDAVLSAKLGVPPDPNPTWESVQRKLEALGNKIMGDALGGLGF